MLADDEGRPGLVDAEEELQRAEVAVGDPQVVCGDLGEDLVEQGALLGVAVGGEEDVGGQAGLLVQDGEHLARQRGVPGVAQLDQAALGGGEVVAGVTPSWIRIGLPVSAAG